MPSPDAAHDGQSLRRAVRQTVGVSSLFRRFVVADRSMEPTLVAGQGLIGVRSRRVRVGQLRCLEHPIRPGFWLVKRVAAIGDDGDMTVTSDNLDVDAVDSRRFGSVPVTGSYRVLVRIPLRWM